MSGASDGPAPHVASSLAPHVLFAILDWGLGHATRSWPLVLAACRSGAQVTLASRGVAAQWLQQRMAEADAHEQRSGRATWRWQLVEKPGTDIRYAQGGAMLPVIALQMPAFVRSIARERKWTADCIKQLGITHVVSDNCYGVHPRDHAVPSVLISHQVSPPLPRLLRASGRARVRQWARRFSEVWIPDLEGNVMGGVLSVPTFSHHRFIGPLSRFSVDTGPEVETPAHQGNAAALVGLVSGPEPQRSLMEEALRTCFQRDGRSALLFAGRPSGGEETHGRVRTLYDAGDAHIRSALMQAECIVCRSGYSTLMDLAVLGRKAALVPTPGQPEQEYLARLWSDSFGWPHIDQRQLVHFQPQAAPGKDWEESGAEAAEWMTKWLQSRAPFGA